MMMLLIGLTVLFLFFSLTCCAYYYFLLFVHLFAKKKLQPVAKSTGLRRVAMVIPAHNEATCILQTLHSCKGLTYPQDKYKIIVIADNCDDETAEIARHEGVRVLERRDLEQKGKGFALAFAFTALLQEDFDTFLVIDADCDIDPQSLTVLNAYLACGYAAVQLNYTVSNPDASPMTYALAVGNYIENAFFYSPKSTLGLAILLRGTGMALTREVLLENPWESFSITEDVEYGINLIKKGLGIAFVHEASVRSTFPVDRKQLEVQRTRWASGSLGFGRKEALKLIISGIRQRRWLLVDGGCTFLVLSKPIVLLCAGISLLLSLACVLVGPLPITYLLVNISIIDGIFLSLYFILGVFFMGITVQRVNLLLQVPGIIIRLMWISLKGLVDKIDRQWEKTPR